LGYAVEMLFPIKRTNIEQREPERWGIRTL